MPTITSEWRQPLRILALLRISTNIGSIVESKGDTHVHTDFLWEDYRIDIQTKDRHRTQVLFYGNQFNAYFK